jgi:deazaflavin-dependent oxidoreductase (nitroreductase family)
MPLPRSLGEFNHRYSNHVTLPFAKRLPGFGVVVHHGRKSGRTYRTPVSVFARPGGYTICLTYGRGDWVKNVMHAGSAELLTRGRSHTVANFSIVADPQHEGLPRPVRAILRRIRADEVLRAEEVG